MMLMVKIMMQQEVCLFIGVVSALMQDGKIKQKRAQLIIYTGKTVIFEKEEYRRIRRKFRKSKK